MATDIKYNSQYWLNGMSNTATDNGKNRKFNQNWNEYNNENYSTGPNSDSVLQKELNEMIELTKGDSSAALVYFSIVLGQTELNKGADIMNMIADQMSDLANVSNLISNLKNLFNKANSYTPASEKDDDFTKSFVNRLSMLEEHLKNDNWLSQSQCQGSQSLYSQVSSAITNIINIVGSKTKLGLSLSTIWQQATQGNQYQPISPTLNVPASNWDGTVTIYGNFGDNGLGFVGYLQNLAANKGLENSQKYITYSNDSITFNLGGFGTPVAYDLFFGESGSLYYDWNNYMASLGWPAQNSENLQTILQSFDTINSSTTSLSASYQGEEQANSSLVQEMGGTLSYTQNTMIQMLSTLNANTKNQ